MFNIDSMNATEIKINTDDEELTISKSEVHVNGYLLDSLNLGSRRRVDPRTNYLIIEDNVLTKSGITYYKSDVLQKSGLLNKDDKLMQKDHIGVFRPKNVLEKNAYKFQAVQLLDEHPSTKFVNLKNNYKFKELGIVKADAKCVPTDDDEITINNTIEVQSLKGVNYIEKADKSEKGGKKGLSVGMLPHYTFKSGTHKGQPFDIIVTDFDVDHVALTDRPQIELAAISDSKYNNEVFMEEEIKSLTEKLDLAEKSYKEDISKLNQAFSEEKDIQKNMTEKLQESVRKIEETVTKFTDNLSSKLKISHLIPSMELPALLDSQKSADEILDEELKAKKLDDYLGKNFDVKLTALEMHNSAEKKVNNNTPNVNNNTPKYTPVGSKSAPARNVDVDF